MAEISDALSFTLTAEGARSLLPHIRYACRSLVGIAALHRAAGLTAQAEDAALAMQGVDALRLALEAIASPRPAERRTADAPPDVLESRLAPLVTHPRPWH
jgi:hypothetical protein